MLWTYAIHKGLSLRWYFRLCLFKKTYYFGNAFFIGKFKFWKANVFLTIHTLVET